MHFHAPIDNAWDLKGRGQLQILSVINPKRMTKIMKTHHISMHFNLSLATCTTLSFLGNETVGGKHAFPVIKIVLSGRCQLGDSDHEVREVTFYGHIEIIFFIVSILKHVKSQVRFFVSISNCLLQASTSFFLLRPLKILLDERLDLTDRSSLLSFDLPNQCKRR